MAWVMFGVLQGCKYRCRQCRSLLCAARNVVSVQEGAGQAAFPFRKRDRAAGGASQSGAGGLFVEPMQWMDDLWQNSGKIYCPSCAAPEKQCACPGKQARGCVCVSSKGTAPMLSHRSCNELAGMRLLLARGVGAPRERCLVLPQRPSWERPGKLASSRTCDRLACKRQRSCR